VRRAGRIQSAGVDPSAGGLSKEWEGVLDTNLMTATAANTGVRTAANSRTLIWIMGTSQRDG
jgi:hypothetical protein